MPPDETTVNPAKPAERRGRNDRAVLEVLNGPQRGTTFELPEGQVVVGKGDANICLEASGVSRSHAKIAKSADGTVSVMDLASTNGTLVNGTPVEVATLYPGDRIQFGPEVVLRLSFVRPAGGPRVTELSARQLQVARLIARGRTNVQIAEALAISPRTVASHVDNIYARLGLSSRAALTRWILEAGLDEG